MTKNSNCFMRTVPLAVGLALGVGAATADDWEDRIAVGGFAGAKFHQTNEELPYNGEENVGHDNQGSFSGSSYGVNIRADINDRVRFNSQYFATKEGDYALHVDWFFGAISVTDSVELRAGAIKFPVGLVNEYVDVGYTYPWLHAPTVIYSELGPPSGPQLVREAYTGGSVLWNQSVNDWTLGADLFGGEVALEGAKVRKLLGATLKADWNDQVQFQVSRYEGTMMGVEESEDVPAMMAAAMEGGKHKATLYGMKVDWNNVIVYAEKGDVTMADMKAMKGSNWYTTLGYRFGKIMPHVTYESYNQGEGEDKQNTTTLGMRWDALPNIAFKGEVAFINTESGVGLFPQGSTPKDNVTMFGLGADLVF